MLGIFFLCIVHVYLYLWIEQQGERAKMSCTSEIICTCNYNATWNVRLSNVETDECSKLNALKLAYVRWCVIEACNMIKEKCNRDD